MTYKRIAFIGSSDKSARLAIQRLRACYPHTAPGKADVIVALGGDGVMLEALHKYAHRKVPIFGMNRGTVGFLMNAYREGRLLERLAEARRVDVHPLHMTARTVKGTIREAWCINEVSLLRETRQAAKLRIKVDGKVQLKELICDGIMLATPAGSTAYNLSAHGPILPIGTKLLALTPISAFRPRRWRGALLPDAARVTIDVLESKKRPVSAVADYTEVRGVRQVRIRQMSEMTLSLLFDPEHNLEDRILNEQFNA
jgi:NAD+ kinase